MKVFIPDDIVFAVEVKELFILTRPFYDGKKWSNSDAVLQRWGLMNGEVMLTKEISEADVVLLPYSINRYVSTGNLTALERYNNWCAAHKSKGYGYITGDWGLRFPEFENITYFRMGGFRSQLSPLNQGFPVLLSDHLHRIYGTDVITPREWSDLPVVGFCGHASFSFVKKIKEKLKFIRENMKRSWRSTLTNNMEPIFPSAYHRALLLNNIRKSDQLISNFIYRDQYRAGVKSPREQEETTKQYFENIRNSDYVLCLRGGGNFSVRFYETLLMGRIPVFINTDCLMPFEDQIHWKEHVVWVEWKDREQVVEKILEFHNSLSKPQFKELQLRNRDIWKEGLSIKKMMEYIARY